MDYSQVVNRPAGVGTRKPHSEVGKRKPRAATAPPAKKAREPRRSARLANKD